MMTACNLQQTQPPSLDAQPTATQSQTVLVQDAIPTPITQSTDWQQLDDGLAWRTVVPNGNLLARMDILKIDPTLYRFRAVYRAGEPQYVFDWRDELPDAVAFVNANFFSRDHATLGVIVSDGVRFGQTFHVTGGTFLVENGLPSIRSNRTLPYVEPTVEQAVEGYPLLVEDGQSVHYSSNRRMSRRTVIAQDVDGNILLMVSSLIGLSLTDLSQYLPTTDMNIVYALNMDGGGSTMMTVNPLNYTIRSFDPVPTVLAVYKR